MIINYEKLLKEEWEVLRYLMKGMDKKEILNVTGEREEEVDRRILSIREKLGSASVLRCVIRMVREGVMLE